MELTAENVNKVLMECLYDTGEDTTGHVVGEGVRAKIGFKPDKLETNKQNIIDMLNDLSDDFKKGKGGGGSFLNACLTKTGTQWGEHSDIDTLLCLGTAIGKVGYPFGREMWNVLPGCMPYFTIKQQIADT